MDDAQAFCAWLRRRVEGGWLETLLGMDLLNKEKAEEALKHPADAWKNDPDAVVLDDHRWVHVWATTLQKGHNLFLTRQQLRRLHDIIVDELARRKLDSGISHKSPLKAEVLELGSDVEVLLRSRKVFLLDPTFINIVGSTVSGVAKPNDLDVMLATIRNKAYGDRFLASLPEGLRKSVELIYEPSGPNGPYIPAYELWAVPVKSPKVLEPRYRIQPMSPIRPAVPREEIEDPRSLLEDSYFIISIKGVRLMVHRRENQVIAFDKDLDEANLPPKVVEDLLKVEPRTFILDGFLARDQEKPIFYMVDMPWWRDSEHTRQTAEERRVFLQKISETAHLKRAPARYFLNRRDTISYLEGEGGPFLLIPGSTTYPVEGESDWYIYNRTTKHLDLEEGADAKIRTLVDGDKWESMSGDERFGLMTKRQRIEPLYPFAQLKTTKKGYAAHEVFGLKSVEDLAKDLFKVPTKQSVEVKIDGFRTQIHKKGDQVRIFTESGHEFTAQIPHLREGIKKVAAKEVVLDAECTPYSEDMANLGRQAAVNAFTKGAKAEVDDGLWALHVFDVLHLDGEDLHKLAYEARRKRLHGLELPVRDVPKDAGDFRMPLWENNLYWATSAEQMIKFAEQVSGVPGSEGAMFKDADSEYRLSGSTPLWSKMKVSYEIDVLVVGVLNPEKLAEGTVNYIGAIGPVTDTAEADVAPLDTVKGKKFVKWKGKTYSVLGKTFNTDLKADVGQIIRVTVKWVHKIEEKVYHWFQPAVVEVREDKFKPDPLEVAETIFKTAQRVSKVPGPKAAGRAFLVRGRFDEGSPIVCCMAPWIAVEREAGFDYLQNTPDLYSELYNLGVNTVIGSSVDGELLERYFEAGIGFESTQATTIEEYLGGVEYVDEPDVEQATIDLNELRAFQESLDSPPMIFMKLSCGALIPLEKPPLKLQDPYQTYPDEDGKWRYSIQFHVRGLSVHADPRMTIAKNNAVGWTWDNPKSLIRPMLRRTPRELRTKAGITEQDMKLPIRELSERLNSTTEGRALVKALSKKVDDLPFATIKDMCEELWKEELEPVLNNPNSKIYTQSKGEMSPSWLDYEREVPPGETGATAELEGIFIIMDQGTIEYGSQKCMAGGTEFTIRNESGRIERCPLDEIVKRRRKVDCLTPKGDFRPIVDWITIPVNPETLLTYELDNGASLNCDFKHPSFVWRNNQLCKISAENLVVGDLIPVNSIGYDSDGLGTWEMGEFLGLYLAEGRIPENSVQLIYFTLNEKEEAMLNFIRDYSAQFGAEFTFSHHKTAKAVQITLSQSGALVGLIRQFVNPDKSLRRNVFGLSRDCRRGLIMGLYEGDNDSSKSSPYYKSITQGEKHRQLMEDLFELLFSVGEIASIRWNPQSDKKYGLRGTVSFDLKNNHKGWWHQYTMPDGSKAIKIKKIDKHPTNLINSGIKELFDVELDDPKHMISLANGIVTSNSYYHEYFVRGKRLNGRFVVRRIPTRREWRVKEAFSWLTFFTKRGQIPYAISSRAVEKAWIPPKGVSALPKDVREQIPDQYRYWKAENPKEVRDELVKAIRKKDVAIKLAAGLKFAVKRVWHKGPEVQRGLPVVRHWILLHSDRKVVLAFNFGTETDPIEQDGLTARKTDTKRLDDLLPTSGDLPADHPASETKKLVNHFDTSDGGGAKILEDSNSILRLELSGKILRGAYAFVREDPNSDAWIFQRTELSAEKRSILMASPACVLRLGVNDENLEVQKVGDLLLIRGPAIKPGEVLPMDGRPSFFMKEGIKRFWPSMYRQPVVVFHGELKGDVIGFVSRNWFDEKTGWGWAEAIIWHPIGIKLILDRKLAAFSIEVLPEAVWDPEHQHEHVVGGECVALSVVPKGACVTCTPVEARTAEIRVVPGKIYKFGMTPEQYITSEHWGKGRSTQSLADEFGKPRSTIEHLMKKLGIPRRDQSDGTRLRFAREGDARIFGGKPSIVALGTGAFSDIPRDECPQCKEARAGGPSRRNYTATLFSIGNDRLLVNAPKGIGEMLTSKQVKPSYVVLEHIHEDVVGGLHELRPLKPIVFATEDAWSFIRKHHRALSKEKGEFDEIYGFKRYVMKPGQPFKVGPFRVEPVKVEHAKPGDPAALGFKIAMGDKVVWHCSDILALPDKKDLLKDVDVFIGDGASLTRGIKQGEENGYGHTSIEDQIKWAQEANIPRIYFTQIGHVGKTHEDLNKALGEMAPNAHALRDGEEISLGSSSPAAVHGRGEASALLEGRAKVIIRAKPHSEYAKQAIYFTSDNDLVGLYVEGFPEGPIPVEKAKEMPHGLPEQEWKRRFGKAREVWVYHPRILKRYEQPRKVTNFDAGLAYIHNVKLE